jgi:antitoxin (DNA-binding transcriptional repressor) of toxin-antitoxin stability system
MPTGPVIGVREFRARLSAYLREAGRGATITIGDRRRRAMARLVPVSRSADSELLDRLAQRAVLVRGLGKPGRGPRVASRRPGRLVSDTVIEDRR